MKTVDFGGTMARTDESVTDDARYRRKDNHICCK